MKAKPCRLTISAQLTFLLLLEDGWYEGDGTAYDEAALIKARKLLDNFVAKGVPMPYVYPTLKNEVRAEWDTDDGAMSLTIDALISEATLVIMDDDTDGTEMTRYPVDDVRLLQRLQAVFAP